MGGEEVASTVESYLRMLKLELAGIRRDYLQRESQNRKLGYAGELEVVAFERRRLAGLGKGRLAAQVEHVSETQGDGLGFDGSLTTKMARNE